MSSSSRRQRRTGCEYGASAGAASLRREERLKPCLEAARERIATLKAQLADGPAGESAREQAAQLRALSEREARIEAALARQPELAAIKQKQGKKPEEARSSTTDADATIMKMGDGGLRPAYNLQFATDAESQVVFGVEVVTAGTDQGQLSPMVEQVSERCGQAPENWLVDGGYPGHGQIDAVAESTTVYAPVPKAKDPKADVHQPKAKALYRDRAATAECEKFAASEHPVHGSRRLQVALAREGIDVGRRRIRRLMKKLGLWVITPKPDTSRPHPEHKVYPYLLRGLTIDRPNQVWATDITYLPMQKGFLYLVALLDWATRRVLAWRLSNTLTTDFCVAAIQEAITKYGPPEIFNTDQGCQFTSEEFTGVLKTHAIQISMDGRGRCHDNIFVERLW